MQERIPKSSKIRMLERLTAAAVIVAISGATWGYFEHRRATHFSRAYESANSQIASQEKLLAQYKEQVTTQTERLSDYAKRAMPVAVIFRRTPSGSGLMTYFKNNAPAPMELGVVLTNPVTERRREVNLIIPPNGTQSIGEAEGWVFAPGHRIQLTHAQFGSTEYIVTDK